MTVMDLHTLVDCGCKAKVYSDGSGVDIEYCDLHRSARDMLKALEKVVTYRPEGDLYGNHWPIILSNAHAAIRRAKGNPLY